LTLPAGRYSLRTFDPKTGHSKALHQIESQGAVELTIPIFEQDVALLIDAVEKVASGFPGKD
jgi:hypothetical protein